MSIKGFYNNLRKEDLSYLMALGICPALAATSSLSDAITMGVATTFVITFSNLFISAFRKMISASIQFAVCLIVIAAFTTIADLMLQSHFPVQSKSLGIYISLIVVNGLSLNRAEKFALKNKIIPSIVDGIIIGILFMVVIMITGTFRELIGNGSILDHRIVHENIRTILLFILSPGAFISLGFMLALIRKLDRKTNQ